MKRIVATVAVDNTYFSLDTDYSYAVPDELLNDIKIGSNVTVPFGKGNKSREGIVVESSPQITEGVPEITGLRFNHVRLYEQLPVERSEIFQEILELTQLLDKYEIIADKIYFDTDNNVTLYFGEARVLIGSKSHIDEKIMQLSVIVPSIQGKAGVLDMREYETGTTTLTFEPD